MKTSLSLLAIFALLLSSGPGPVRAESPLAPQASILYVTPTGAGNCSGWGADACGLQKALNDAVPDDEIWVMMGTYKPTVDGIRDISFGLKTGVAVYGGFDGTETLREARNPAKNFTILSGDIGTAGDSSDNSYHVVTASGVGPTAVLDGFTITAGHSGGAQSAERL